ncbi:unnamed protein product [Rotaria magnacalcarata]|uniref:G-protein coupled receptors family 1 profile domain-containing protein n=1 Tax=Rotaria magnacalcarata TaxID=392030 RepID=A0A819RNR9_9BILA|nr:unnamed protein product [Rotaria magnacalcarata]CAF2262985.1 unnamed protein product [Rotaria magnacalcarata]CAF4043773.1 unnamed protein product [Rotaria magnacalcarata]CAF4064867.1 unnamed protein product [Rotaria magnacalcarata]
MNDSSNSYSISNRNHNIQTTDRLLSIYSLLLILIGTPCNLLCCIIYLKKSNRSNSIKIVFGFLAFLDTVALYTFNLNYVFREFNVDVKITYFNNSKNINNNGSPYFYESDNINTAIIKRNLEEYSLFICRFLSYLAFSTLQTSSWVLAFASFNRFLLVKRISHFEFICKRRYTIAICLFLTCLFFLSNIHILWMNGYHSSTGDTICYKNLRFPNYMLWHQRLHLFLYSVIPSIVLFIFNALLMRIIFASKKRLDKHRRLVLFAATATTALPMTRQRQFLAPQQISPPPTTFKRSNRNNPARLLYRHSRKLTISLIFITISYFTLTFPSTVIFSFFRAYIEPPALRRTISLLFTNLSTTTHAIRFFIYFFCSTDFRKDFYDLFLRKRSSRRKSILTKEQSTIVRHTTRRMESESTINKKFLLECDETEKTRKE